MRVVRDVTGTPIRPPTSRSATWSTPSRPRSSRPTRRASRWSRASSSRSTKSKAAVILVRMEPDDITPDRAARTGASTASSATPRSAPTSGARSRLYERTTHHVLCPCHQSTFDLADSGKVVFGPAARPLPQLPIVVDSEGYLVAQSDFTEPVGPSFWERDSDEHRHEQGRDSNATTAATAKKPSPSVRRPRGSTTASASPRSPRSRCARSSPTTGPSCSARSRCGASSSCCSPARS